jgi:hypothetical protein
MLSISNSLHSHTLDDFDVSPQVPKSHTDSTTVLIKTLVRIIISASGYDVFRRFINSVSFICFLISATLPPGRLLKSHLTLFCNCWETTVVSCCQWGMYVTVVGEGALGLTGTILPYYRIDGRHALLEYCWGQLLHPSSSLLVR